MGYNETVRFLLSRGARVDLIDGFGRNALHWAIRGGFAGLPQSELEMVKLFAAVPGVNVNNVDKEGMTPLLDSIALNRTDMMNVLLGIEKIDVNMSGKEGSTPLMLAIRYNRNNMIGHLLGSQGLNIDAVDEQGRSALYHTVAMRNRATVKTLLDRKAKTNTVTKDGKTLLHAAFGPATWYLAPESTNIEDAKLLFEYRDIDINKADDKGNTILYLAIRQDRPDLVKLLLSRPDLDVNKPTPGGGRYFHQVIGLPNLRYAYEMAIMLLDRQDVDVNTPYDHNGNTAVHMSWYFGNSATDVEIAKKILARNPNLEVENVYGDTPLIYNIDHSRIEMVKLLVTTKGIDLNHPEKTMRRTPLALAKYRKDAEIADLLQKAGAKEYSIRYFYKNLTGPALVALVITGYVLPLLPTILLIISKIMRSKPLMIASLVIGILPIIAIIKLSVTPLIVDDLNITPIILLMVCVPWLVIRTPAYLVCKIKDDKFKRQNFFLHTMFGIDALLLFVACIIGLGIIRQ